MRLRLLVLLSAGLLAAVSVELALGSWRTASPVLQGTVQEVSYRSGALGGVLRFGIYLPPGYSTGAERYRTIATRRGRALVGVSAGGYGALLITLHHLDAFGVVESWSGYFHPTDTSGTKPIRLGSARADERANAHKLISVLKASLQRKPTFIGFYVGDRDARFAVENVQLHRELSAAGVPHEFRLYPGGHSQALWQREAAPWLGLALAHLERSQAPGRS